jgi:hypothetical protein
LAGVTWKEETKCILQISFIRIEKSPFSRCILQIIITPCWWTEMHK